VNKKKGKNTPPTNQDTGHEAPKTYTGPGESPSWTGELSGNWTRNIAGIGSSLVALVHDGETPVLQLANLHGDIVATALDSETSKSLASTIKEPGEYGVPTTEAPSKYSWLGAHQLPTTLPSGVIAMGARSYIPQLGRFLQTDPVSGGSANQYAYTYGDPVNSFDPSGEYTAELSSFAAAGAEQAAKEGVERKQAEEAAREEAERKAAEADEQAFYVFGSEGEEEWWEWEEEGEWEYASYHQGNDAEHSTGPTISLHDGTTLAGASNEDSSNEGLESKVPRQCLTAFESVDDVSEGCIRYLGL
jgi:RHS repeat-associated protein